MTVTIKKGKAYGAFIAPPSKSMAHRSLICAALANGESTIENVAFSKDVEATIGALKALGAGISVSGSTVTVAGGKNPPKRISINCGESGSTLRFLLPICLAVCPQVYMSGSKRLFSRPLTEYEKIFNEQGIEYNHSEKGISLIGKLNGGDFVLRGDVSSQFISGLLFALPILTSYSHIILSTKLESAPYVKMTLEALKSFGIKVITNSENTEFFVNGAQKYIPQKLAVEGDYSNAAFFEALNTFGGNVEISGLNPKSLQGDKIYKEHFMALKSGTPKIDISNCPDLGPVLFAVAAAENGAVFTGTNRLKLKESDRGTAMAIELLKFGVQLQTFDNYITVNKAEIKAPQTVLYGHNDHRIVMALSILATLTGGTISGAEAVEKSMPDFFDKIAQLGIEVTKNEDK